MRDKITKWGVADADELETMQRQVREHLANPDTVAVSCLYFLAWGRKPTNQEGTPDRPSSSRPERCDG